MIRIDGETIASEILAERKQHPIPKTFLAAFVVGEDEAGRSFLARKKKVADELGVDMRIYELEAESNDQVRGDIRKIAQSRRCGGVLLQLPLPDHLNSNYCANVIPPAKDVDVLGERMRGAFSNNRSPILPPAVSVVRTILKQQKIKESDLKTVAVVGQGFLVGRPITTYLLGRVGQVCALDKGSDFSVLADADLVVSGAGVAGLIKPSMLKPGAGVIDFGYSVDNGAVSGDFDSSDISDDSQGFYTPTPKGTGPILVAHLFLNFITLAQ